MEWLDWTGIWDAVRSAMGFLVSLFWVWFAVSVASFPFLTVQLWKFNKRLDTLGIVESILSKRDAKAKKLVEETEPLPPRSYAENMADHERATKRLSEGVEP